MAMLVLLLKVLSVTYSVRVQRLVSSRKRVGMVMGLVRILLLALVLSPPAHSCPARQRGAASHLYIKKVRLIKTKKLLLLLVLLPELLLLILLLMLAVVLMLRVQLLVSVRMTVWLVEGRILLALM